MCGISGGTVVPAPPPEVARGRETCYQVLWATSRPPNREPRIDGADWRIIGTALASSGPMNRSDTSLSETKGSALSTPR